MRIGFTLLKLARDRRGVAAMEAALVMPILLVTMAGLIDGARAVLQYLELQAAAQAGADYARNHGGDTAGAQAAGQQATPLAVSMTPAPTTQQGCASSNGITPAKKKKDKCAPGNTEPGTWVIVTATAAFSPLMPWGGQGWQPNMRAVATVRID